MFYETKIPSAKRSVTDRDPGLKRDPARYKTRYVPANIELDNLIINIILTTKYLM